MRIRRPLPIPLLLLSFAASASFAFAQTVEQQSSPFGLQYRVRDGAAEAVLISGAKQAAYRVRVTGTHATATQFDLLGRILTRMQQDGPLPNRFSFSMAGYREPLEYLARTAACDRNWDGARGQPLRGTAAPYLLKLLEGDNAFPALSAFFRTRGYRVQAVSIEQILTEPCRKPQCDATCPAATKQRVPADALISFEIQK